MSALVALVGLVVGIEGALALGGAPATAFLGAGVVALVGAWVVQGPTRLVIVTVALALLGCALMQRALDGAERSALPIGESIELRGTLVSDADPQHFRTEALVRLDEFDRIVVVRATATEGSRLSVLAAGDHVEIEGFVAPLEPGSSDRWRHAVAMVEDARVLGFADAGGVYAVANRARGVVERGSRPMPADSRALLLGFLLGDTRGIPDDVIDDYRTAGLSHLLAVSGANVAFVLALAGPGLRRLRLGTRTVAALGVVMLFAAMTRFEPSVLRASVLATVSVLAVYAGRPQPAVRALCLAIIALLLVDPFLSHSVGFRLSCAASAGIVVAARPIARRLRGPARVREALSVSLAAQLGVTPVLLATFGSVPIASPVANLLAAPAAELLGVFGMVACLLGGMWAPLAIVLQPVDQLLLAWVTGIARITAAIGGEVDARGLLGLGLLATLAHRALRRRAPRCDPVG